MRACQKPYRVEVDDLTSHEGRCTRDIWHDGACGAGAGRCLGCDEPMHTSGFGEIETRLAECVTNLRRQRDASDAAGVEAAVENASLARMLADADGTLTAWLEIGLKRFHVIGCYRCGWFTTNEPGFFERIRGHISVCDAPGFDTDKLLAACGVGPEFPLQKGK